MAPGELTGSQPVTGVLPRTGPTVDAVPAGGGGVGDGVDHVGGQRIQHAREKFILFGTGTT